MQSEKIITLVSPKLLHLFLDVIKIEALSLNENKMANFIFNYLKELNLNPIIDDSAKLTGGNCGNVICEIGNGGNTVLLSHMDTARSTKDVNAILLDDRIVSDGTTVLGVDNRVGITCLLFGLKELIAKNIPLNDFTLAFTTQEETTLNGSQYIQLDQKIKMGIIFDSHLHPGNFINQSAGSMGFRINVIGKAAHSGLAPEKGIDSIKIASLAISKIKFGKLDDDTTANIGIIRGGTATNVVPELTFIEGEIRSTIPSKIEVKLEEIKTIFENTASENNAECKFESFWNFKPYTINQEEDVFQKVVGTLLKLGLTPTPNVSKGGSDANSLNARGITSINLGIGAQNPHSNDEFILYDDFNKTAEIAMEMMKR